MPSSDLSFSFSGRPYRARLLSEPGKGDALVFGLSLNPKLDKVWVLVQRDGAWVRPTGEKPSALGRAAVAAIG